LKSFDMEHDRTGALRILRYDILSMAERSGHVAVALSCVDIIAALYFGVMDTTPGNVECLQRDHFILSKGHGCMALYAVLARAGYIDPQVLESYARNGSLLAEHPLADKIPAIECATGTLGHGLAIAAGLAEGLKMQGLKGRVFVLLGDGECDEGSVWEAAALAANRKLDNLVAIIDRNGLQACAPCTTISPALDLAGCWQSFGWDGTETDGHDYDCLVNELSRSAAAGQPRVLFCQTVKGKGVDFMEGDLEWHYRPVRGQEKIAALKELADA